MHHLFRRPVIKVSTKTTGLMALSLACFSLPGAPFLVDRVEPRVEELVGESRDVLQVGTVLKPHLFMTDDELTREQLLCTLSLHGMRAPRMIEFLVYLGRENPYLLLEWVYGVTAIDVELGGFDLHYKSWGSTGYISQDVLRCFHKDKMSSRCAYLVFDKA